MFKRFKDALDDMLSNATLAAFGDSCQVPDLRNRQIIAHDAIARAKEVTEVHTAQGATLESTFIQSQLPPLDQANCPNAPQSAVEVVNSDSFTAARCLIAEIPDARGKTAVLNLASDVQRAGGWIHSLSKTQEEALCYSSTLYETLKKEYYPWPNVGPGSAAGVYSPGVVVFRDDLDHGCVELPLEKREIVSVLTVAAPRHRRLTEDRESFREPSVLHDLQEKIRLIYRMAASNGQRYLILGAIGCGAYACPPRLVANEMKSILLEPEFEGWFNKVVFAVYSRPGGDDSLPPPPKGTKTASNFDIFETVFADTYIGKST